MAPNSVQRVHEGKNKCRYGSFCKVILKNKGLLAIVDIDVDIQSRCREDYIKSCESFNH